MPVDMPLGAGNDPITIYDDSDPWLDVAQTVARTPGPYTYAEVKLGVDLIDPAAMDELNVPGRKAYRFNQSFQHGDTGTGTATTTLTDTNVDIYVLSGKSYQYRATQPTSWFTNLGTKVGTDGWKNGCSITHLGAQAIVPRGTLKLYGCRFVTNGGGFNSNPISGSGSEMIGCQHLNQSTGAVGTLGLAANKWTLLKRCSYSGGSVTTVIGNTGSEEMDDLILCATAPQNFITTTANDLEFANLTFQGTPSQSDIRGNAATQSLRWKHVRPVWSLNAPKFTHGGAGSLSLANSHGEYWKYNVRVSDGTGAAVAGVPVKLTDAIGDIPVDTTTASDGTISFGSGLTEQMVRVLDFYSTAGVISLRHRSPFLVEINTGSSRNSNYQSVRYYKYWPGYETVTNTAGRFTDVNDMIPLEYAAGAPTTWIEMTAP